MTWRPFLDPIALHDAWWVLVLPLTLGVAMAYKAVRVQDMSRYWRLVGMFTAQVILAILGLAVLLYVVVIHILPVIIPMEM